MRTAQNILPLQIKKHFLQGLLLIFLCLKIHAQDSSAVKKPIDVDFLFNYYEQEGIHSAVTGGLGTEELRDIAGTLVVNVPMDSVSQLAVTTAVNHYTSASSDRINPIVSSASVDDFHIETRFDYSRTNPLRRTTVGVMAGASSETDYISVNIGMYWVKSSADGNRELSLKAMAYFDSMMLIFPDELRGSGIDIAPGDKRRTFQFSATWSQVLSKRLQASISADAVLQDGMLATPFHRIFFSSAPFFGLERLPTRRLKFPMGLRLNVFPLDFLVLRTHYRFYWDDWNIRSHTATTEIPLKVSSSFTFYPFYRYHTQTGARWFAPYGRHDPAAEFYTSDFDLSAFDSHKLGLGLQWAPFAGIGRWEILKHGNKFKSLDLRFARYLRSDGLSTYQATMGLGFEIF